jgi:predicted anti-sigma-YlaC factor YlaD
MTDPGTRALLCDRSREWLALRLDGDLSEFETALLTAHVQRCESCRTFGAELAGITGELRAAPLERPSRPVAVPRLRRRLPIRQLQLGAAAAVLVVAAGAASLYGTLRGSGQPALTAAASVEHAPMVGTGVTTDPLLRDVRVLSLTPSRSLPLGATKPVLRVST